MGVARQMETNIKSVTEEIAQIDTVIRAETKQGSQGSDKRLELLRAARANRTERMQSLRGGAWAYKVRTWLNEIAGFVSGIGGADIGESNALLQRVVSLWRTGEELARSADPEILNTTAGKSASEALATAIEKRPAIEERIRHRRTLAAVGAADQGSPLSEQEADLWFNHTDPAFAEEEQALASQKADEELVRLNTELRVLRDLPRETV